MLFFKYEIKKRDFRKQKNRRMIKLEKKNRSKLVSKQSCHDNNLPFVHRPGIEPGSLAQWASVQPLNHKCCYPPPVTGLDFYSTCCLITSTETREKRVSGT